MFKVRYQDTQTGRNLYRLVRAQSEHQALAAVLNGAPAFRYVVRSVAPVAA